MKAWLIDSFTGIEHLRQADVPDPVASANQVVVKMQFAALNPADRYLAQGEYPAKPPLPHILGRDGVGTILSIGAGVTDWKVGDEAVILRGDVGVHSAGTFAEKVAAPVESLVGIPVGWTLEQSAGAALVYMTAYQAIMQWPHMPENAVMLVTGASGGVGIASVHLGKALGYTVLGLSRDESKWPAIEAAGAERIFNPKEPNWRKQLREYLANRAKARASQSNSPSVGLRVNLAIDNIGGPELNDVIETLAEHAAVSCVGRLAGPVPNFNTAALFFRRIKLGGVAVGAYTNAEARAAWKAVLEILAKTNAKPLIDQVFDFDQLPQAFGRLKDGPIGKVLIRQSRQLP